MATLRITMITDEHELLGGVSAFTLISPLIEVWGLTPEAGTLGLGIGQLTDGLGLPLEAVQDSLYQDKKDKDSQADRELPSYLPQPTPYTSYLFFCRGKEGWKKKRQSWKTGRWGVWTEDPNVGHTVFTLKVPSTEPPSSPRKASLTRDGEGR